MFKKAVNEAMLMLADDPRTVFVGQSVRYDGTAMYASLDGVPMDRRVEMPVIEDFQLGFCTGLALTGVVPVCLFPRFDFLLLAANQLVNHLDKLPRFGWHPKVIIRTTVGAKAPLDAGPQHTQDHTEAFRLMMESVPVLRCTTADEVTRAYEWALAERSSTLIVEAPGVGHGSSR
jgi:pyruvate/2-oxoglutarate/acetoin dehydrogenase E1 component